MPALVAGIHVFLAARKQDVDGRDKPGHDGMEAANTTLIAQFLRVDFGLGEAP
jgi:hypothetical protein